MQTSHSSFPRYHADIELDETWKATLRKEIEDSLSHMVAEAEEILEIRLKENPFSAEARHIHTSDYIESTENIRKIVTARYSAELEWEREQHRWSLGQAMRPGWMETLQKEQEIIMDRIKARNERKQDSGDDQGSGMRPEQVEAVKQDQRTMHSSDPRQSDSFQSERRAQIKAMYTIYEQQWSRLIALDDLRWDSFPWPTPTMPTKPVEITPAAIRGYILSPDFPEGSPTRPITARVEECIQRWNPSRLDRSLLVKVVEADKELVLEGAWAVIIGLKDILREEEVRKKREEQSVWGGRKDVAAQRKENEIMRRENEILQRENEILKREKEILQREKEILQREDEMLRRELEARILKETEEKVEFRQWEEEIRKSYEQKQGKTIEEKETARARKSTRRQTPESLRDPAKGRGRQDTNDSESATVHPPATDSPRPPPPSNIRSPPERRSWTQNTTKAEPPTISITPPRLSASASTTTSTTTPTPPPPLSPLSEESWAQRQAEFAEKQRESFRQEQERLETERQARLKRARTPERAINPIFAEHQRQWEVLSTLNELRWGVFPWPMLRAPSGPHEITLAAINSYIISERNGTQTTKERVKDHLRRWHPDRFETKLLGKVVAKEREVVKVGAAVVVRSLNMILTQLNASIYA